MSNTRSILITGCSSGIGWACALGLKARGWRVFATARKPSDILRLGDKGVEAFYMDYAEPESIVACVDQVLKASDGKLTALFNNGAYGQPGAVEDIRPEVLRAQFEVNVVGWHDLTRRIIPAMRKAEEGRIVNCSSILGLVSMKYRGAYNASKYAVEALTDAMRQELKGTGIHVSLIEPGPIRSRFVEHALEAYRANIDIESSAHAEIYKRRIAAMERGGKTLFKREPEAVLKKLIHAIKAKQPKPRYYVTVPAHLVAFARRALSTRMLDFVTSGG